MILAIRGLVKKNKTDRQYVFAFLGFVGALYTMQMMEFNLIMTFSENSDNSMYLMQLFIQGAIFLFSLFVIGLFIYKAMSLNKKNDSDMA